MTTATCERGNAARQLTDRFETLLQIHTHGDGIRIGCETCLTGNGRRCVTGQVLERTLNQVAYSLEHIDNPPPPA